MPVIPKTTNPQRMADNLAALTACSPLTGEDMAALDGLDQGASGKRAWDPNGVK
jgi:diketogulonate reductase-like aldo/keto reductase